MTTDRSQTPDAARSGELEAVLRKVRREACWNHWYDLPGRDVPALVIEIDRALGEESTWLPRFAARFPKEHQKLVEAGLV